jgi:2-phosphosulfolactate phosphatase
MKFNYTNLETCCEATGVVIVVDVIRAFTNAAFAFSRGAKEIHPVSAVDEALQFKVDNPDALAFGEVGGYPPEGFDYGNSPTQTRQLDLTGRVIVQRTGAGTQGIVRSVNAESMLAASFVVASATFHYIQKLEAEVVTFVITGEHGEDGGDEDRACAEYLESLLRGGLPDPVPYLERARQSRDALLLLDPDHPAFPASDLGFCCGIDTFDFAMRVHKENGHRVIRAVRP